MRKSKYNWDLLLNGDQHTLIEGSDFNSSVDSFRRCVYEAAKKRNLKVTVNVGTDVVASMNVVTIQAYLSEI